MMFFTKPEQIIVNVYGTTKTLNCQRNLEKKKKKKKNKKLEVSPLLQNILQDYCNQTSWYGTNTKKKKRQIDKWNRIDNPEGNQQI